MGILLFALCALISVSIIGLALWAGFNPSQETTGDEAEWMNAIK